MFVICPKCGAKYQIPAEISLKDGQKMKCSACEHLFVFESEKPILQEKYSKIKNESIQNKLVIPKDAVIPQRETLDDLEEKNIELPLAFQPTPVVFEQKKNSVLLPVLMVIVSLVVLLLLLGLAWQYRWELQQQNNFENLKLTRLEPIRFESPKKEEIKNEQPSVEVPQKQEVQIPVFLSESEEELGQMSESEEIVNRQMEIQPYSFRGVRYHVQNTDLGEIVQIEGLVHNEMDQELYLPESVVATAYGLNGNVLFKKAIYLTQKTLNPKQEVAFFGTYSPAPEEIKWIDISFPN